MKEPPPFPQHIFSLSTSERSLTTHYFKAATKEDLDEWNKAIKLAISRTWSLVDKRASQLHSQKSKTLSSRVVHSDSYRREFRKGQPAL